MKKQYNLSKAPFLQRGLAVVEFVIMLPFLILVALAVTELGRGMYQYNTLSKAVHDGARYLSDNAMNTVGQISIDSDLELQTKRIVVYGTIDTSGNKVLPNLTVADITVSQEFLPLSDSGTDDNHVRVTASYDFTPIFPALSVLGYSLIPEITVTSVERALQI
jgi:Flp pilus assembly protein TadG